MRNIGCVHCQPLRLQPQLKNGENQRQERGNAWFLPFQTFAGERLTASKEAQRIDVVADQQVFGLLVVVEHHFVVFTADTGLLVATERGMRRV